MMTISILIVIYIACIVFIRTRNKATLPLIKQLSNFSTFMVPFNIPIYLFSRIPMTHYVSKEYFPEINIIEDSWKDIQEEALALYEQGLIAVKDDLPASSFYKDNRWTSFYLKSYSHDIPSAYEVAPKTMALIDQVSAMHLALFACLNPGKKSMIIMIHLH